jgi:hypothetical protein
LLAEAPRLEWRGMTDSTPPLPPPVVFVERILDYVVADAPARTVLVRIYQPVQRGPHEWKARVVISAMDPSTEIDFDLDHSSSGIDGVQALFEALRMAGDVLARHPGLSQGKCKPWEPVGFLTPEDRYLDPADRFL